MPNRKQVLLDAALTLFIEHGYANTTIKMILDYSDVSKGTFYKFFHSKNDCLVQILEQSLKEDLHFRKGLEDNDYIDDTQRFIDQIAIPMTSSKKQRVSELFWTVFYSGEVDTRDLAKLQVKWLSERLEQLYGEEIKPYAYEGAIFFYGMLHQIAMTRKNFDCHEMIWKEVVSKVLKYVELLMNFMRENNEHILDVNTLSLLYINEEVRVIDRDTVISKIRNFNESVQRSGESKRAKEMTAGLLSLITEETLNFTLLEVVLKALQWEFEGDEFRVEVTKLTQDCWLFLELENN